MTTSTDIPVVDTIAFPSPGGNGKAGEGLSQEFLLGPENRLVATVVQQVADFARGRADTTAPDWLNPLVIVGRPGSGKTHLARGLAAIVAEDSRESGQVSLMAATDFASQFFAAASEDSLPQWQARLRGVRMWVLEDIGRLSDRPSVQAEMFHCLDELLQQGSLVVITANRPPQQMSNLSQGIRSRLEAGLMLSLSLPSQPVREEFLRRAAASLGVSLETRDIEQLARCVPATPRQLLGAIQQIRLAKATPATMTDDRRPETAGGISAGGRRVSMTAIQTVASRYFGVPQATLKSASRRQSVVHARSMAMYVSRELAGYTLQEIGKAFGGRDHTTVLHACRKIEAAAASQDSTQEELADLRRLLLAT